MRSPILKRGRREKVQVGNKLFTGTNIDFVQRHFLSIVIKVRFAILIDYIHSGTRVADKQQKFVLHEPVAIHSVKDLLSFGPDLRLLNERASADKCYAVLLLLFPPARRTATLSVNVFHQVVLKLKRDQFWPLQVQNNSVQLLFFSRIAHQHSLNALKPAEEHVE